MPFDLFFNIENCYTDIPYLLYYSHIPTSVIALLIGIFVLKKGNSLVSKLLFTISVLFALWALFDIILWKTHDGRILMFVWSLWGIIFSLISIFILYFTIVFVKKKDVVLKHKLFFGFLFLPILLLTSTQHNLIAFNAESCDAIESKFLLNYILIFLGGII